METMTAPFPSRSREPWSRRGRRRERTLSTWRCRAEATSAWRRRSSVPCWTSSLNRQKQSEGVMKSSLVFTRREAIGLLGGALSAFAAAPQFPKGAIIRTVLKDIPPQDLAGGATLFHEHMSLSPAFLPKFASLSRAQNPQAPAPPAQPAPQPGQTYFLEDLDLMVEEIRAAAKEGVACLVDAGHPDMGRSLDFLKHLSMQSGMPIVSSAGYYTQPFYPPEVATMSEDQIAQELIRQANTAPFGAFGEIGTWDEITPDERK